MGIASTFQGVARNVQWEEEQGTVKTLRFRIEQIDSSGDIIRYIPVEFKGFQIRGSLIDGDEVRVTGKETISGIHQPKEVVNLKTQTNIEKRGMWSQVSDFSPYDFKKDKPLLIFPIIFVVIFVATFWGFFNILSSKNDFENPGESDLFRVVEEETVADPNSLREPRKIQGSWSDANDGFRLTVKEIELYDNSQLTVLFEIENLTGQNLELDFLANQFYIQDDLGNRYRWEPMAGMMQNNFENPSGYPSLPSSNFVIPSRLSVVKRETISNFSSSASSISVGFANTNQMPRLDGSNQLNPPEYGSGVSVDSIVVR